MEWSVLVTSEHVSFQKGQSQFHWLNELHILVLSGPRHAPQDSVFWDSEFSFSKSEEPRELLGGNWLGICFGGWGNLTYCWNYFK